ncbi:MAG TPA: hypothetical protein VND93_08310 [Myxococcales bacterium]|nr:hypothetical protein [Myxococcales bacterium]
MLGPVPIPTPLQVQLHNELYQEAVNILRPYLPLGDGLTPGQPVDPADVERGLRLVKRVLEMDPDNWSALWLQGMAFRVVDRLEEAYQSFHRAFQLKPDQVDVGRELVLQCCMNGRGAEAVQVSRQVVALRPDDGGLLSNHALAQLLAGDVNGAQETAERAVAAAPENRAARGVRQAIQDVLTGRIPRPYRWPWADATA